MQQPLHELKNTNQQLDDMKEATVEMRPSRQTVRNILAYSKALKVNKLKSIGQTEQILN
jgi:hypothetical protein